MIDIICPGCGTVSQVNVNIKVNFEMRDVLIRESKRNRRLDKTQITWNCPCFAKHYKEVSDYLFGNSK